MNHHVRMRAFKYYGVELTGAEQKEMRERIARDEPPRLRDWNPKRDKLPIYLVHWPRIAQTIAVVVRTDFSRLVTVLPPDCNEVRWRFGNLFGSPPPQGSDT